jgi:hypothetical protein
MSRAGQRHLVRAFSRYADPANRSAVISPPCNPPIARRVGEAQQQVAMTWLWRAEAHEVFAAQFIECAQEIALRTQPSLVARNNHCTIAINADAKRISPFAAASNIDAPCRYPGAMFIENLAHRNLHAFNA